MYVVERKMGCREEGETPEGGFGNAEDGMIRLRIAEVNNFTLLTASGMIIRP
jgi:hypothetical protein